MTFVKSVLTDPLIFETVLDNLKDTDTKEQLDTVVALMWVIKDSRCVEIMHDKLVDLNHRYMEEQISFFHCSLNSILKSNMSSICKVEGVFDFCLENKHVLEYTFFENFRKEIKKKLSDFKEDDYFRHVYIVKNYGLLEGMCG